MQSVQMMQSVDVQSYPGRDDGRPEPTYELLLVSWTGPVSQHSVHDRE